MAEQHRGELISILETSRMAFRPGFLHQLLELRAGKELRQLAKDATKSYRGVSLQGDSG
jgi:hypothetical protein